MSHSITPVLGEATVQELREAVRCRTFTPGVLGGIGKIAAFASNEKMEYFVVGFIRFARIISEEVLLSRFNGRLAWSFNDKTI